MICYNWELNDWMSIVLQIWDNFYAICLQILTNKKQNTRRVHPAAIEKIKFFFLQEKSLTFLQKITSSVLLTFQ